MISVSPNNSILKVKLPRYRKEKKHTLGDNPFSVDGHFWCYKLKEGKNILVSAG